ncbi:MAG: hypothetical protein DMF92_01055 [Acidobacteria bacterium]|nr:MAG: hypothetical protein DMF92_01055 [Acidobacteriota bacterium]
MRLPVLIGLFLSSAGLAAPVAAVETDPIACWWRTSASAVRVGQTFDVVLTCAVVDNGAIVVIPDESGLDASAMQMPPFEIIGGKHPADRHTADRRFLQYGYTLRLIADDSFGKDIALPDLQIKYQIQTRVNGEAVKGRALVYLMPKQSVRVLALVPNDAPDIRDAGENTFDEIDARTYRADLLSVSALVLFTIGVIIALVAAVRLIGRSGRAHPARRHFVSDRRILRGVARELSAVHSEREASGWTEALAGRVTAALRIAGAYALARRVSQTVAARGADAQDGQLLFRSGRARRARVLVSSSVTAEALTNALTGTNGSSPRQREDIEQLQLALSRFTANRYNRTADIDGEALDESLDSATQLLRRLAAGYGWLKPLTSFTGSRRWAD